MTDPKELVCRIAPKIAGVSSYRYEVLDGDKVIHTGHSSSLAWVMNDAGSYHTKRHFDPVYGEGNWVVTFPDGWDK